MRQLQRVLAALGLGTLLFAGLAAAPTGVSPVGAAPAQEQCGNTAANPSLSVDRATIGIRETAVVNVTGRSYLLPPHQCGRDVFGGIYLFFGWVQPGGQWGPSFKSSTGTQGLFGTTYSYPGEGGGAETRDDGTGSVRLVSFTAGGESGTATPFHMDPRTGNWQSNLTVRGATYSYKDLRTGTSNTVDCRVVQCGVFTVGAHGKASRTNERFIPINFVDERGVPVVPSNPNGAGAGGVTSSAPLPGGDVATGTGSGGGSAGSTGEVAAETTVPGSVGSVGEAPSTTEDRADTDDGGDELLESETAASVQEFGADGGGGGSSTGLVLGGLTLLVALAVGGGVLVLRRRAHGAGMAS